MSGSLGSRPENILVVDDELHVREVVRRTLAREGYACSVASSGEEAWAHLHAADVDLITLDVHMPKESGVELLARVQQGFPDVAVIMLTAVGRAETAIQSLTHGACAFLTKPIDSNELIFHVKRGLERRFLILERRSYTETLENRVREQTKTIRLAHEETIHRLVAASMYRDEETGAHIARVGLSSAVLAEAAGWSAESVEQIRMAAPMHDVGKIGIPDSILQKPGKLTDSEFEIIKSHTLLGARLLSDSDSPMLEMAREIALSHHERWDGTGYPYGLAGLQIPECSRLVALADVYDALTHDRVYRGALPEQEVLAMMGADRGKHFDPKLYAIFLKVLPALREIAQLNPDARGLANSTSYMDFRINPGNACSHLEVPAKSDIAECVLQ